MSTTASMEASVTSDLCPSSTNSMSTSVIPNDSISSDSGVSSAISEEEVDTVDLLQEKRKLIGSLSSKAKATFEEIRRIIYQVERAVRHKKIFSLGGNFPSAKRALLKRGWIEVTSRSRSAVGRYQKSPLQVNPTNMQNEDAHETNLRLLKDNIDTFFKKESNFKRPPKAEAIYAKLTKNFLPNYEWSSHRRRIPWKYLKKDQVVNKFPSAFFTTKTGLLQSLQHLHWFSPYPVSSFFPRCYQVSSDDERQAFVEDYRVTACISILQWFVLEFKKFGPNGVECYDARARRSVVEFSLLRCRDYVAQNTHQDVDVEPNHIWEHQWDQFLTDFYLVCHENSKIQTPHSDKCKTSQRLFDECNRTLDDVLKLRPEAINDGFMNIWIIKPGSSSRGRGITMEMRLENIIDTVTRNGGHNTRYVVQKYVERPFLIYDTKFDIRQWFVVTSWNPLVVWMYRDSYLRFCSRPFTLNSGHESIHLCNNAVQSRYSNAERSCKLPVDNMWDSKTFSQFLKEQGHGDKFNSLIYPTMKRCLIGTLLANQDYMEFNYKCNAFELYGADFLLSYDLKPWLIEINSSPALGNTTSVTTRMCSALLEDIVRITVDRRRGRNPIDTGNFELIYKQAAVQPPLFVGANLTIQGSKVNINPLRGAGKSMSDKIIKSYYKDPRPVRLSPSHEDLKALIAQAHRSVYRNDSSPIITDLIDNIMSIPSCLQDAKSKVTLVREWIKQNPKPPTPKLEQVEDDNKSSKEETPIKEPYNGGTGDVARKAALQAQQSKSLCRRRGSKNQSYSEMPVPKTPSSESSKDLLDESLMLARSSISSNDDGPIDAQNCEGVSVALPTPKRSKGRQIGSAGNKKRRQVRKRGKPVQSRNSNGTPQAKRQTSRRRSSVISSRKGSVETETSDNDGTELDPREKALTALALRSLANHFILNRTNKKQINLSYTPNSEDPKLLQQQRYAAKCRSSKLKTLFRRASQSSSASSHKSKASSILDQIPVCEQNRCLVKYGCCHNIT